MTKPIKISRQAIKEGLEQTPIEQILLGASNPKNVRLTKKQKDFAKAVALGKPKAQAYREAYDSNAKPATQSNEGYKLTQNPAINTMIEAFKVANEAREYLIPAQIRTMAIQNLVGIAIDEGEKTSNKLKALELIGKMSEVALFTERKELVHTNNAEDIKAKLIEGLRQAFTNSRQVNDLAKRKAESLLVELSEPRTIDQDQTPPPFEDVEPSDPPTPDPQNSTITESEGLHSNLHNQSLPESDSDSNSLLTDLTLTAVKVTKPLESDTCESIGSFPNKSEVKGVSNSGQSAPEPVQETPPVSDSNKKGGE